MRFGYRRVFVVRFFIVVWVYDGVDVVVGLIGVGNIVYYYYEFVWGFV